MTGIHQLLASNFSGSGNGLSAFYLVVAGGGGAGGNHSGAGGGGELNTNFFSGTKFKIVAGQSYNVHVGGGGTGGAAEIGRAQAELQSRERLESLEKRREEA